MKVKLGEVINIYDSLRKPVAKHKRVKGIYPYYGANGIQDYVDKYIFDGLYILIGEDGSVINKDNSPVVNIASGKFWVNNHAHIIQPKNNTLNFMYLYYALKKVDIYNLLTKSIPPKLNQESLKNIIIFIPPVQTQKEIVAVLDKVTSLISMRKEQLEKLDILVKSKFIEMFGDPVLNPKGWEKKKLGEVCSSIVRGPFGSALKKEYFVPYSLGVYKVYEQKNAIKQDSNIGSYYISEEKFVSLKRFECKAGDIIMSCSGTVGKMYTLPENAYQGIINQALMKMTLNGVIIDKIFKIYFGLAVENLVLNGSGIKNISSVSYLKNIEIQAPPLDIQNQFAEFVEQVEKNKEKIKSSLNQLETLYSALMQEYFG